MSWKETFKTNLEIQEKKVKKLKAKDFSIDFSSSYYPKLTYGGYTTDISKDYNDKYVWSDYTIWKRGKSVRSKVEWVIVMKFIEAVDIYIIKKEETINKQEIEDKEIEEKRQRLEDLFEVKCEVKKYWDEQQITYYAKYFYLCIPQFKDTLNQASFKNSLFEKPKDVKEEIRKIEIVENIYKDERKTYQFSKINNLSVGQIKEMIRIL